MKEFLAPAYKKGLKKNHHFHISDADSGKLLTKEYTECENNEQSILCGDVPQGMPTIMRPAGSDKKRQTYLYNEIHCSALTRQTTNEPLVKRSKSNC